MSLLLIARKIWRYKLATLPIALLVLVGSVYVIAVKAPQYEASSTYILVNPPPPPTDAEIARDPALGRLNSDNPYTRYSDQSVLVQVLASRLNSDEARRGLIARGADPSYTIDPSAQFGFSAPIVQITGTGTTPGAAVGTANLVGQALTNQLKLMQTAKGVAAKYRIDTQEVVAPHNATLKASGKLRALVAVFALGAILLFVSISVAEATGTLREERARTRTVLGADDIEGARLQPLLSLDSEDSAPTTRARRGRRHRRAATKTADDSDPDIEQWPAGVQN
jgi:hypothetical protein